MTDTNSIEFAYKVMDDTNCYYVIRVCQDASTDYKNWSYYREGYFDNAVSDMLAILRATGAVYAYLLDRDGNVYSSDGNIYYPNHNG